MSRRRINYRLVRLHILYTTDELALRLGVHKNTIRHWMKLGLTPATTDRPILFHGGTVADFLRNRREQSRTKCLPGQMYCLRCRAAREPAFNEAEYLPITMVGGNLRGLCSACCTLMHRRVSLKKLSTAMGNLDIKFPEALPHITDRAEPCLNCDFKEENAT